MAERVPARLTRGEGRRFGLTVGSAFLVLALLGLARHRDTPAEVFAALGLALLAAGIIVPGRLGPVYRAWMGLALAISRVTTPIVLGVLYFGIVTPIGLLRALVGRGRIGRTPNRPSFWVIRDAAGPERKRMEHQF
jgi:hypothetical protein